MKNKLSMKGKIIAFSVIPTLISLSILGSIAYFKSKTALIEQVEEKIERQVHFHKSNLEKELIISKGAITPEVQAVFKTILAEKVGKTGYLFIIDMKGDLILHPSIQGKNAYKHQFVKNMIKARNGSAHYDWDGKDKIAAYKYIDSKRWILASSSYTEDFLDPVKEIRFCVLLVLIITGGLTALVSIIFSVRLSRSISDVADELVVQSTQNFASSQTIADSSKCLANEITSQAASLEQTAASLEEISNIVDTNASISSEAQGISEQVKTQTGQGLDSINRLSQSMKAIVESNDRIQDLVEAINNINDKTSIIDEIVFQTKLLSFNASVEAERAGEHGRGFAVVAQEVGNLAQLSGKAATEISVIVKEGIELTESISTENRDRVTQGTKILKEVTTALEEINDSSVKNVDFITQINTSSVEQSQGIKQINAAVASLDKGIQQNASDSTENSAASLQISDSAAYLKDIATNLKGLLAG